MMVLSFLNHLQMADRDVRNMTWNRESRRGRELCELTLGIIGFGHTGQALAKVMNGFGMRIIAYDKYVTGYGNLVVEELSSINENLSGRYH